MRGFERSQRAFSPCTLPVTQSPQVTGPVEEGGTALVCFEEWQPSSVFALSLEEEPVSA